MTCRGFWGAEFDCLIGSQISDFDGELVSPAGSVTCDAGSARSGKFGYRCVMNSSGFTSRVKFGGEPILAGQVVSWRFYVKLEGYPAADVIFAEFGEGFLTQSIYLRPDGRIHFGGFPTLKPTNDVPLPLGAWTRFEVALSYSDPSVPTPQGSIFEIRIDGNSIHRRCMRRVGPSGSPSPTYDACYIGWADTPSPGLVMHFDDVGIYEGVWGGDGHVERLQVTSIALEDSWVPGAWRNVAGEGEDDGIPPPPGRCVCGRVLFGTPYPVAGTVGPTSAFNATPPIGFSAGHALEPIGTGGGSGRDYGEDKMVSSPGRDKRIQFLQWARDGCVLCGPDGITPGLGYTLEQAIVYDFAHLMTAPQSVTCQLAAPSGHLRAARRAGLISQGDASPSAINGTTGYMASFYLPGLESADRNFDVRGAPTGGDFPTGWASTVGPIIQEPGGISTIEFERDPGDFRMQICMMTVVADVGSALEDIKVCKRQPLGWT